MGWRAGGACALAAAVLGIAVGWSALMPDRVLGAAAPAAKTGDAYVIRLNRPVQVGQKYGYTSDATIVQTLTANLSGQVRTLHPRSVSIHFEGTEEVLAVDAHGQSTRAQYTVTQCTAREGKQEVVLVQPGRVVTVDAGKFKSRIDVDQGGLTIQDELLLRALLSLRNVDDPTDDECFGSDKVQMVGETWPVRPDPLVRSLVNASGAKIKKQDVSGTTKFAAIENVGGVVCLRVQGKSKIEHYLPPAADLPAGSKVIDSTFEYKFTKLLPADQVGQCLTDSHSVNLMLKLRTDEAGLGSDIIVDGKLLRTVGIRRKPLR